jgi:hypothetical protein
MSLSDKKPWVTLQQKKKEAEIKMFLESNAAETPKRRSTRLSTSPSSTVTKRLFQTPGKKKSGTSSAKKTKKMTHHERHIAIAKAIFSTGAAFRIVENPFFRKMFDDETEVPSRFQVAGDLLDEVYKSEREKAVRVLASVKALCIVTDGWTSRTTESIINYVLVNPFIKPIFWKSVATGEAAHDSSFIASEICKVIDEIHSLIGRKVVCAVVTVVEWGGENSTATARDLRPHAHTDLRFLVLGVRH